MRLYIIRHGETDWNKLRRLQGQVDIPLNEFGRHLAKETALALRDIPFDFAVTSPLSRAKETAYLVLGERDIPVLEDARLKEMGFGEYEGLCCREEGWNIPDPDFRNFFDAPENYQPPKNGESFMQLSKRLDSFLTELYQNPDCQNKTILLSTHGAALCGILRLIKGNPISRFWDGGVHRNCAVTIVDVERGKPRIVKEAVTFYQDTVENW
ncbi:histidine phosphatase family protein [Roseburia hominis]